MTLTDISPAMVDAAREKLADVRGVKFECADIQNLPYPDASFDVIIANMMLYHVPDIARGLRVCLKNSLIRNFGVFCAISASSILDLALLSLRIYSLN